MVGWLIWWSVHRLVGWSVGWLVDRTGELFDMVVVWYASCLIALFGWLIRCRAGSLFRLSLVEWLIVSLLAVLVCLMVGLRWLIQWLVGWLIVSFISRQICAPRFQRSCAVPLLLLFVLWPTVFAFCLSYLSPPTHFAQGGGYVLVVCTGIW